MSQCNKVIHIDGTVVEMGCVCRRFHVVCTRAPHKSGKHKHRMEDGSLIPCSFRKMDAAGVEFTARLTISENLAVIGALLKAEEAHQYHVTDEIAPCTCDGAVSVARRLLSEPPTLDGIPLEKGESVNG